MRPRHAQAWGGMVQGLASASALDGKTAALAYLAVLAALRLESGVPFHVQQAKQRGASRDEVISAILVGLPAAGHGVTQVLPAALAAYATRREDDLPCQPNEPARTEWNATLNGDFLWSNVNFGEAIAEATAPLTWSVLAFTPNDWDFRCRGFLRWGTSAADRIPTSAPSRQRCDSRGEAGTMCRGLPAGRCSYGNEETAFAHVVKRSARHLQRAGHSCVNDPR